LAQGAIAPLSRLVASSATTSAGSIRISWLAAHYRFRTDVPWGKLTAAARQVILYGSDTDVIRGRLGPGRDRALVETRRLVGDDQRRVDPHLVADAAAAEGQEPERITFSSRFACPVSGFTIPEIEPRLFSLSGRNRARSTWPRARSRPCRDSSPRRRRPAPGRSYRFRTDVPWGKLTAAARQVILYGSDTDVIRFAYHARVWP
jgi:excinuclease UvrABC ATPase subunit